MTLAEGSIRVCFVITEEAWACLTKGLDGSAGTRDADIARNLAFMEIGRKGYAPRGQFSDYVDLGHDEREQESS